MEYYKKITTALGSIALGTILLTSCKLSDILNEEPIQTKEIKGRVYNVSDTHLIYDDSRGLGSGKTIPIPISFVELKNLGSGPFPYIFVLAGPHNLEKEDRIELDYIVDSEITGKEIWDRYYPDRRSSDKISSPNVSYQGNGYIVSWKKNHNSDLE
jgi:hypothetical protein